jgi:hypothetical protein
MKMLMATIDLKLLSLTIGKDKNNLNDSTDKLVTLITLQS